MRIHRIGLVAGLLLAAQLAGTGCILIPKLAKRSVLLVVSRIATVPLHATGSTNTYSGAATINLRDSVDLASAVSGAGIDVSKVDSLVIGKVEYRVVVPDVTPSRAITNGNLQVAAGGRPLTNLITGFSHSAGAVTPWIRADLVPGGVTALNQMLHSILVELKGGATADEHLGYLVSGTSDPTTVATDFIYQIRLTILISGRVPVDVLN